MRNWLHTLSLSLLAAASLPASAVYVNPRGTGQVLLFPYYTVNAQQQTMFSVVNTTDRSKLVEVSFRESYNGRVVLRFDVVLSPHDTWTVTTFDRDDQEERGAAIGLRDNSCTVPDIDVWTGNIGGAPFQQLLPFDYTGDAQDGGPTTNDRMREGYFHVVERGELIGDLATAATQRRCSAFQDLRAIAASSRVTPPTGGLRGSFAVVNVGQGTLLGGNATAIEALSTTPLVSATLEPAAYDALAAVNAGGEAVRAQTFVNGKLLELTFPPNRAVDAISAVLMTDSLFADVSREASLGSNTEWVITAPTKRFHTDAARAKTQLAPFTNSFNTTHPAASCSNFSTTLYDRQGRAITLSSDPQGTPPPGALPQFALCHATDVVSFGPAFGSNGSPVLGAKVGTHIGNPTPAAETGALTLALGVNGEARSYLPAGSTGPGLRGLPVIGFEALKYINGNVTPGVLANYTLARPLNSSATCTNAVGVATACP
ncbi:MAG: hypothetical protein JNN30_17405 [Rhodanobacteraceae bacterium]|nr:hypothetical protein [Rhodanobacteraceae bacterium]